MYHLWEGLAAVMDAVHAGTLQLLTSCWQMGSRGLGLEAEAGDNPQRQLLVPYPGMSH